MKLVSGIADARRISAVSNEETQSVLVTDGEGYVRLSLGASSFPAALSAGQARRIARDLLASAKRVEQP